MDGLQPKIRDGTIEALVARRVLVGWHDASSGDYGHLGRISDPQDPLKAKLTFLIGRDVETEQKYLLYFHLPVRTRRLSKNSKSFYLVVPLRHLDLGIDTVPACDLPTPTSEQIWKDGLSCSKTFVRVRLRLRSAAYVIMPILPRRLQSNLKGLPAQLLLRLKSLSVAREMDVFMEDDASDDLQEICTRLQTGESVMPELDLEHMFSGCRGGKNNWGQYPCSTEDAGNHVIWNPFLDEAPPPYTDAVGAPPLLVSAPHRSTSPQSLQEPRNASSGASSDETRLTWRRSPQSPSKWIRAKDAAQPEYILDPCHSRKRKAIDAFQDGRYLSQDICPGSPTEADPTDGLDAAESQVTELDQAIDRNAHRSYLQAHQIYEAAILSLHSRVSLADTVHLDFSLLQKPDLFLEIREWLLKMWDFDIFAHATYRRELLELGCRARQNQIKLFDSSMAELQDTFIEATANRIAVGTHARTDFREQSRHVSNWLRDNICRNVVTLMAKPLVELRRAAETAKMGNSDGHIFYGRKADCLTIAFYTFGGKI